MQKEAKMNHSFLLLFFKEEEYSDCHNASGFGVPAYLGLRRIVCARAAHSDQKRIFPIRARSYSELSAYAVP